MICRLSVPPAAREPRESLKGAHQLSLRPFTPPRARTQEITKRLDQEEKARIEAEEVAGEKLLVIEELK